MRQPTLIEELQWKIIETPWRCDDQDLSILLDYTKELSKEYEDLKQKYHKVLEDSTEHIKSTTGNILMLLLDKAEKQ